ncbi:hypothetical protein CC78DRAFT_580610 [Lojkania enalia]|uniref:Uncharacterized protein n=1 Tax=Lojkania enalia TaxID=147567 RepID=A0A9P4K9P1_9PLEO|nr:hypothetical protein CC78DRAFT_580610 [Didymosphaeria enalia]
MAAPANFIGIEAIKDLEPKASIDPIPLLTLAIILVTLSAGAIYLWRRRHKQKQGAKNEEEKARDSEQSDLEAARPVEKVAPRSSWARQSLPKPANDQTPPRGPSEVQKPHEYTSSRDFASQPGKSTIESSEKGTTNNLDSTIKAVPSEAQRTTERARSRTSSLQRTESPKSKILPPIKEDGGPDELDVQK